MWAESVECKKDRISLRIKLERMAGQLGTARGTLRAYQACTNGDCPFVGQAEEDEDAGMVGEPPNPPQ
jgi:hypothetical protein